MARLFSIKPSITLKGRKFRGLRGWTGKPLHPPLTDLPIAAYLFAAAFDLISFFGEKAGNASLGREAFVAATFVIVAGALASTLAIVTGFWDWVRGLDREKTGPLGRAKHTQVWRTANWHAVVMVTTTVVVIVDIICRMGDYGSRSTSLAVVVLSCLAALLVSFGSFYGGSLVFDYQFNVEGLKGSTAYDETEVDQLPGQKSLPPPTQT
ncbi:MAG: DUF2231 domain-containing protein [Actinomycetota bacterium]